MMVLPTSSKMTGSHQDKRYRLLSEKPPLDEEDIDLPTSSHSPRKRVLLLLAFGFAVATTLVILLATFQAFSAPKAFNQCGHTPEEARKRGCTYELTSFSWLPEDCLDLEVEQEFLAARDWKFYRDINGTQEVSLAEVRRGEAAGFFVAWEFHTAHCGFLLKKLHRAMKSGGKVDSYIGNLTHTDHCIQFMLDPPPEMRTARQFTFRKYPFCGRDGDIGVVIPQQQQH